VKVSDIAKVAEGVPSTKSTTSGVGGMYKRLTASDIEEEKKAKMGMKKGGKVSSASKRADGCAVKGKTRGKMV
jgi:glutamate 5-kinase